MRDHRPGKWSVAGQGGYIYVYIYKSKHYTMVGKGAARVGGIGGTGRANV